jgi:hypothetical protein
MVLDHRRPQRLQAVDLGGVKRFDPVHPAQAILNECCRCSRPPCTPVTAEEWKLPVHGFPSRRQVLADDLIRCHQLRAMKRADVLALLGEPDDQSADDVDWLIGDERDSFFQVDSEFLAISFKEGVVSKVEIAQG